jgi:hypothetical protein
MQTETIFDGGNIAITARVDRTSDPGDPNIQIESGCNELWLNADEAQAVLEYLQRIVPTLKSAEL